jgi:uncharacterized protein (TIGR02611 family)
VVRDGAPPRSRTRRFGAVRARVRALPGGWIAWRIGITLVGAGTVAVGIVLLPLPGPGWLIIFAGLGILGTEYEWAARLLRWVRRMLVRWTEWLAARPLWIRLAVGAVSLAFLAALLLAVWFLTGSPGL